MSERAMEIGMEINHQQLDSFMRYTDFLNKWNRKVNLTTITEPIEVIEKHFLDSIMIFQTMEIKQKARVIDIGTGAGFPAVPMKIIQDDLEITLVDALQKRVHFLKELSIQLGSNMEILHARAEELAKEKERREGFDYAVSRAVAKLNTLVEYTLPFVKVGGAFIAWKGPSGTEEIKEAKQAMKLLGAEIIKQSDYELRTGERRMLIIMKKVKHTPQEYPRKNAMIKSRPL